MKAGFTNADVAGLTVLTEMARANEHMVQDLARLIAAEGRPRRPRRYQITSMTRGPDGELVGKVEYADGRRRRFRTRRDENDDLVTEIEDVDDAAPAQAVEAEPPPAPAREPEGSFADVFGRIDGLDAP